MSHTGASELLRPSIVRVRRKFARWSLAHTNAHSFVDAARESYTHTHTGPKQRWQQQQERRRRQPDWSMRARSLSLAPVRAHELALVREPSPVLFFCSLRRRCCQVF